MKDNNLEITEGDITECTNVPTLLKKICFHPRQVSENLMMRRSLAKITNLICNPRKQLQDLADVLRKI
ncbi:CLUMA_CG010418, isoform A [Clunio marinus]|uniref:CLUMA_CG010418, isoform A n=1 Tax=Clunio marinus TaxID=568069 RepID=A0A1J1I9Q5_9DIPT|nr:CLUMA_CG010418, isoform A [Clunio marinus]